jgi:hypothetical protein
MMTLTTVLLVPSWRENLPSVASPALARGSVDTRFVRPPCEFARGGEILHIAPSMSEGCCSELLTGSDRQMAHASGHHSVQLLSGIEDLVMYRVLTNRIITKQIIRSYAYASY